MITHHGRRHRWPRAGNHGDERERQRLLGSLDLRRSWNDDQLHGRAIDRTQTTTATPSKLESCLGRPPWVRRRGAGGSCLHRTTSSSARPRSSSVRDTRRDTRRPRACSGSNTRRQHNGRPRARRRTATRHRHRATGGHGAARDSVLSIRPAARRRAPTARSSSGSEARRTATLESCEAVSFRAVPRTVALSPAGATARREAAVGPNVPLTQAIET